MTLQCKVLYRKFDINKLGLKKVLKDKKQVKS